MIRELKIALLCFLLFLTMSLYLNTNTFKELITRREEIVQENKEKIHTIKINREKILKGRHLLIEYSRSYAIFKNLDTEEKVRIELDLNQYTKLASTKELEDSIFILVDGYLYKRANPLTQSTITKTVPNIVSISNLNNEEEYYIHTMLLVKDTIIELEKHWGPYQDGYSYSFENKKEFSEYQEFEIIHEVYLKLDEF